MLPNEVIVGDERLLLLLETLGIPISLQTEERETDLAQEATERVQQKAFYLLFAYLTKTQKRALDHLQPAIVYEVERHMQLDANTARNLELFRSARSENGKGSLSPCSMRRRPRWEDVC